MKYYFNSEVLQEDMCYTKQQLLNAMKECSELNIAFNSIEVTEAVRETGVDYFFCKYIQEVGIRGEGMCGRECKGYLPINGKSGRCKHWGYTYEYSGKKFILSKSGRLKRICSKSNVREDIGGKW